MNPHEAMRLAVAQSAEIEAAQRAMLTREYTDRRAAEIEQELDIQPPNVKIVEIGHILYPAPGSHLFAERHTHGALEDDPDR